MRGIQELGRAPLAELAPKGSPAGLGSVAVDLAQSQQAALAASTGKPDSPQAARGKAGAGAVERAVLTFAQAMPAPQAEAVEPVAVAEPQEAAAGPAVLRSPSLFSTHPSTETNLNSLPKRVALVGSAVRANREGAAETPVAPVGLVHVAAVKVGKAAAAVRAAAALVDTAWA